ncbi:MAG: glycoside hydrolase 43 family protein [Ignavibacteriales bacterium]|nr:glycoside hydrolase 43 family protein [Ignavibacteriales bacterium]
MRVKEHCSLLAVLFLLWIPELSTVAFAYGEPIMSNDSTRSTWSADNGNGTFTNPIFYDEFSDPDVIRVGDDYYLTGTTMHAMPGLPVLHSRDLVNWKFVSYALDQLDLGPEFRLEDGKDVYGQGIWAPCFRFHNGTFYIFCNVNKKRTQRFTATNPAGPWTRTEMNVSLHDLSVLFDDDGKVYMVWGYDEVHIAELNRELTDIKPGTERIVIPKGGGAGEGSHFYKIAGKYFITMAIWDPTCYQVCARAEHPFGPYEITVISSGENLGIGTGWRIPYSTERHRFETIPPPGNYIGCDRLHQGGIVQTQSGEWWALSMMDHNSVGRVTCLSPVTWENGWPYLGLPGNLTRTPVTWIKPNTGFVTNPSAPYERSDDFSSTTLKPIWQWNHVPVASHWSLTEQPGTLCLRALPAEDFWHARNSLTQRAIGPESIATAELEAHGLKKGDVAGLALLNYPYGWIALVREREGYEIQQFDQRTNLIERTEGASHIWLRVHCNFDIELAQFSYSTDGEKFVPLGAAFIMGYQLKTFQGVRFALFDYNAKGSPGGVAAFNGLDVSEPRPWGLTKPIPYGEIITLTNLGDSTVLANWKNGLRPVPATDPLAKSAAAQFKVIDKGYGRIALQSQLSGGFVSVGGSGQMGEVRLEKNETGDASTFQWQDMMRGDVMLMSLKTHRYLFVDPNAGSLCSADCRGPRPDRKDGSCYAWTKAGGQK